MSQPDIASALEILNEFHDMMEDMYWESSEVTAKDLCFDLIMVVNRELMELAKLSIQDHDMPYEPVTGDFRGYQIRVKQLWEDGEHLIQRHSTRQRLQEITKSVLNLYV